MKLRTVIFWLHLCLGVAAGLVILLMSVTGVLLTYERQLIAWSDSEFRSQPAAADAARMPLAELVRGVTAAQPELAVASIAIGSAVDAPVVLTAGPQTVYVDAYSGRVLGRGNQGVRKFMSAMRGWHRWFAVEGEGRAMARAITGWSNVFFLVIIVGGLYLWLPRRWSWSTVKAVTVFNPRLSGKARDFNWHNSLGLWSAVPLLIVVAAAVPISFPWGTTLVYRLVGDQPPAAGGGGGAARAEGPGGGGGGGGRPAAPNAPAVPAIPDDIDARFARAVAQEPGWRTITLRLPPSPRAPLPFAIDRGDGGQPHLRSTLTLARATGDVVSYEAFADQSPGRRLRSILRFAHTGEVLGIPGQTIAGLATFAAVILGCTGLMLTVRRFAAWRTRRASRSSERVRTAA